MARHSLNAIRAFEAAARLSSFKEAAEELGLTASAVSRHIRALEASLGIQLFVREFRRVEITPAARAYAKQLTDAFRQIDKATDAMDAHGPRGRRQQRLSLSVNATFMTFWLADRLAAFRKIHPAVDLDVSVHDDYGKGGNPRADLMVVFSEAPSAIPGHIDLGPLCVIPVCAPRLLSGPLPLDTPADLLHHSLLHEYDMSAWEEWAAIHMPDRPGLSRGTIFREPWLAIREAINGGGVALADDFMIEDLLRAGTLVAPFDRTLPIPQRYYLVQKPMGGRSHPAGLFSDWFLHALADHAAALTALLGTRRSAANS